MGISDDLREAVALIGRDPSDSQRCLDLAKRLAGANYFKRARQVLKRAKLSDASEVLQYKIRATLAVFTYKDQDEPAEERLNEAQKLLEELRNVTPAGDPWLRQDVLGNLGAVHKRSWELDGKVEHLTESFRCYEQGYLLGNGRFFGYTAVNAAFIQDLLANAYSNSLVSYDESDAKKFRDHAEAIRKSVVKSLNGRASENDYWDCVTMGEAFLGVGSYEDACKWMKLAAALKPENWMVESTARQIAQLVRIERLKRPNVPAGEGPGRVLEALVGDSTAAESFQRGKVGLALSGGGFRASLFHIGVLARLAELDLLRYVEVISCVSGGSILGAYYYLELQKLFRQKTEPTHADYIRLVQCVERNFVKGVQQNIRLRVLLHPKSNLELFRRNSSTTHRIGDLYEQVLFSRVADDAGKGPRYMHQLHIKFPDQPEFNPKYDNWLRRTKVSSLVLNATTLNTGHNWQFTATSMGEPPERRIDNRISANDQLRRMWYTEAPPEFKKFRLGHAVAASACVPGLFDPLALDKLYNGHVARLVDGGVFDNQGVASLREQDCTVLLVSDASGQMGVENDPKTSNLAVPVRANNVLMARVRQSEYQYLDSLEAAGVIRGFMFIHLKKGLSAPAVNWRTCDDKADPVNENTVTDYGMRRDVQRLLAAIRTDLDAFSDIESDALMLSGYRMTEHEIGALPCFPAPRSLPAPPESLWRFLRVHQFVGLTDQHADESALRSVRRTLGAAHFEAFKAFRLLPGWRHIARGLKCGLLAMSVLLGWKLLVSKERGISVTPAEGGVALFVAVGVGILAWVLQWWRRRSPAWHYLLGLFSVTVGWIYLVFHLWVLDPIYLRSGPKYAKEYPADCPDVPPKDTVAATTTGQ